MPDGGGAFQPGGEGGGESVGAVFGGILVRGGGFGRDVERDAEVAILCPDVLNRNDAGEAGDIFEILIGPDDALEVVVGEEALGALAGDPPSRLRIWASVATSPPRWTDAILRITGIVSRH